VGIGIVFPSREAERELARHTQMLTFEIISASVTMLPPQLPTSESRLAQAALLDVGRTEQGRLIEQIRSCLSAIRK
jgi:hypothetical protein